MAGLKLAVAPTDGPVFLGEGDDCTSVHVDRIVRGATPSIWLIVTYGKFHNHRKVSSKLFVGETLTVSAGNSQCEIELTALITSKEAVMLSFVAPKELVIDREKVRMKKESSRVGIGEESKQCITMMPLPQDNWSITDNPGVKDAAGQ